MALIFVHKIMIGTALAFCLLFTARALWVGDALLGAFFGAVTVALGFYFRWFVRNKAAQTLSAGPDAGDDN
jgi:hypothetical protein